MKFNDPNFFLRLDLFAINFSVVETVVVFQKLIHVYACVLVV